MGKKQDLEQQISDLQSQLGAAQRQREAIALQVVENTKDTSALAGLATVEATITELTRQINLLTGALAAAARRDGVTERADFLARIKSDQAAAGKAADQFIDLAAQADDLVQQLADTLNQLSAARSAAKESAASCARNAYGADLYFLKAEHIVSSAGGPGNLEAAFQSRLLDAVQPHHHNLITLFNKSPLSCREGAELDAQSMRARLQEAVSKRESGTAAADAIVAREINAAQSRVYSAQELVAVPLVADVPTKKAK